MLISLRKNITSDSEVSFDDLLKSNKKCYPQAAIRVLLSEKWLKKTADGRYKLHDQYSEELIPLNITALLMDDCISEDAQEERVVFFLEMLYAASAKWHINNISLRSMLDGILLLPVMLRLQQSLTEKNIFAAASFHTRLHKPLTDFFLNREWMVISGGHPVLSDAGKILVTKADEYLRHGLEVSEVLLLSAARSGIFLTTPASGEVFPFTRVTLGQYHKRSYSIRYAEEEDLKTLMELEKACWPAGLRLPRQEIDRRLTVYPGGQFVIEENGKVLGVIYSQRIREMEMLYKKDVSTVGELHRAEGGIIQLLSINIFPAEQSRGLGDELLEFIHHRVVLMHKVETVCAITRSRDFKGKTIEDYTAYIHQKDEYGYYVDPIIRFHQLHGASLQGIVHGYRIRDKENLGNGILISYDVNSRQRYQGTASEEKILPRFNEEELADVIKKHITGLLPRAAPLDDEQPLMEMGLDSGDLMGLGLFLGNTYNVALSGAFFFEFNTIQKVVSQLSAQIIPVEETGKSIEAVSEGREHDIAVISTAFRFPGACNKEAFWDILTGGKHSIINTPDSRWNWPEWIDLVNKHQGINAGGYLDQIDEFDAAFFRISPREAELMDPQQRVLLELTWELLELSGYKPSALKGSKTGVYIGASGSDYELLLAEQTGADNLTGTGTALSILANRLSYFYDFEGPSMLIDTACSSSLVAVNEAVTAIRSGKCTQALAGGIHLMCHPTRSLSYYQSHMLSKDGRCKTFDADADGYVRGEGAALLLLKPLEQAIADGDRIQGIIKGGAVNHGGQSGGLTVPNPDKQRKLLEEAYANADVTVDTVNYLEAHGTGTMLGDPIEIAGMTAAFNRLHGKHQAPWCGIGSVKTNLGHLEAASGMAGIIKVLLAMEYRQLPATINFKLLNPKIDLAGSPFYIQHEQAAWLPILPGMPLRAGVSSFGIGGANAHVVLESFGEKVLSSKSNITGPFLFVLSAKNAERLMAYVKLMVPYLEKNENLHPADLCFTLQTAREEMDERLSVTFPDIKTLTRLLKDYIQDPGTLTVHRGNAKAVQPTNKENGSSLQKNAIAWCYGTKVNWHLLYGDKQPSKILLPTYPFAKDSHWITRVSEKESVGKLHPLLHRNTSNLLTQQFSSVYTGMEFFLKDHKVMQEMILPGVAYLELVRVACEHSVSQKVTAIRNITWLRPLKVNGSAVSMHVNLHAVGDEVEYEVYTEEDGAEVLHSEGIVSMHPQLRQEERELAGLRSRITKVVKGEDCYQLFRDKGFDYGPGFQGIKNLYYNEMEALSEISLSVDKAYVLHPGLLDNALQTCVALNALNGDTRLMLPFGVKEVMIDKVLPDTCWCYVKKSNISENGLNIYDIELLDNTGKVLCNFRELTMLPVNGASGKSREKSLLFNYDWIPSPLIVSSQPSSSSQRLVILAGASVRLARELQELTGNVTIAVEETSTTEFFIHVLNKVQEQVKSKVSTRIILVCKQSDYHSYGFVSGLLKTAAREHPGISWNVLGVKLMTAQEITALLETEQYAASGEIRYVDGIREERKLTPHVATAPSINIKEGGVYLITGGAGGIGQMLATHIRQTVHTQVILTGRRELMLELAPGIIYLPCDVTDKTAVMDLVSNIKERYGKLDGVVHSAGVIRDSFLVNKTIEEVREVLLPKVEGAKNLVEATRNEGLDFMVFFSSIAGILGNTGQADYAAANAFLDGYAAFLNKDGRTLSISWPLWKNGGMQLTKESGQLLEMQWGMLPMPSEEGISIFNSLLNNASGHVVAGYGEEERMKQKLYGEVISHTTIAASQDMIEMQQLAAEKIREMAAVILKLSVNDIDPEEKLGDYGFDSISFTRLANELNTYYNLDITPTIFYNYPAVQDVVTFIATDFPDKLISRHTGGQQEKIPVTGIWKERSVRQGRSPVIPISEKEQGPAPVAIIGVSGRFPGSPDIAAFWNNISTGKDLITEIPSNRWDWREYYGDPKKEKNKTLSKWGGFIADIDKFDPLFFNISPREAELMDPQQRITLETVYHALEDAGISPAGIKGSNTGVFMGLCSSDYSWLLNKQPDLASEAQFSTGIVHAVLVNRISYLLNIHGPSEPVDAACASSLIAIHKAVENIRNGNCEMAIAGGVNSLLSPGFTLSFSQAGMLSADGRCKSFDQSANGYVRAEGVGVIILKSLSKAEADGDHIYGIIRNTAENHGGKANTLTSPNPLAQRDLLLKAYRGANIDPRDVTYIEAHGTGTSLGDPIETEGLKLAFKELYKDKNMAQSAIAHCALGSVKANIGHLEAGAGIAGVIKVLLCMKHGMLTGNPHLKRPNEYLKLEGSPFYLQRETTVWKTPDHKPRIAGISSFGFGGANAHVILEEYKAISRPAYHSADPAIIILSAKNEARLMELVSNLRNFLVQHPVYSLHDIAYTLQVGRENMEERLAIVVSDTETLLKQLTDFIKGTARELFTGNTKKNKTGSMLKGSDGQALIKQAMSDKAFPLLAGYWIQGMEINWEMLYPDTKPDRISLPVYPFARQRYWVPGIPEIKESPIHVVEKLHPLLHFREDNNSIHPLLHKQEKAHTSY